MLASGVTVLLVLNQELPEAYEGIHLRNPFTENGLTLTIILQLDDGSDDQAKGLLRPGLDSTRLFFGLTAGAGTRCMTDLSSSPSLSVRRWKRKSFVTACKTWLRKEKELTARSLRN